MWWYLRHLVAVEDGRERGRTISELGWRPWAPGRVVQGHGDLRSRDGRYVMLWVKIGYLTNTTNWRRKPPRIQCYIVIGAREQRAGDSVVIVIISKLFYFDQATSYRGSIVIARPR